MPGIVHRTLTFLVLAGFLLPEPWLGVLRAAEPDPSETASPALQCADRLEK